MDTLAQRLDRIQLRVRAPGVEIYGALCDRARIAISFGEDTYPWLAESRVEQALAVIARLLSAHWGRRYHQAIRDSGLTVLPPELRDPDYEQARAELTATGTSADGLVSFSAVNLRDFRVRIPPGTIRAVPEATFVASANEAAGAFVADHLAKIRELKQRHFG
ncbi:MAG TPA: hypothetical protein VJ914_06045 [Pseudonocardiaceae bacterium]|nr:hypothetical protein [Pseudonocardiaceae bacterium]